MPYGSEYIKDNDIRAAYLADIRSKKPKSKSTNSGIRFGEKFVEKSGFYHKELFRDREKGK